MFGPGGTGVGSYGGVPNTIGLSPTPAFPPPRPPFSYPALEGVWYVDSAAGSNQYPYNTWATAAVALSTISAIDVVGDTVYVASTHNETVSGIIAYNWAGTVGTPTRITCADKTSGAPPSTIATGATITNSHTGGSTSCTGAVYMYGITLVAASTGAGATAISPGQAGSLQESCTFQLSGASGTARVSLQNFKNCTVQFGAAGQSLSIAAVFPFVWSGGSLSASGTAPTNLVNVGASGNGLIEGVDLSALSTGNIYAQASSQGVYRVVNCSLPGSWSGLLASGTPVQSQIFELVNCDSAGTNYLYHLATYTGDVYQETSITRSGGATDGTTAVSRKLVSNSTAGQFPTASLVTRPILLWNTSTSPQTATVEFIHDSATNLQNDEIWMQIEYLGSASSPLGSFANDAMANVLATPADQPTSTATWLNTGGMSNPNKQKLQVPFTAALVGFIQATIYLCKPSYTVYVDPLITLS